MRHLGGKTTIQAMRRIRKFFKGLSPFRRTVRFAEKKTASSNLIPSVKSVGKYEYVDNGISLGSGVYGEVFKGWRKDVRYKMSSLLFLKIS